MLKAKVGQSIDVDNFTAGAKTASIATEGMDYAKLGFLYTSVKNDIKEVIKGVRSVTDAPIIGCTSS